MVIHFTQSKGEHSELCKRIFSVANTQSYTEKMYKDFVVIVLYNLSNGFDIDNAITDAQFIMQQVAEQKNTMNLKFFNKTFEFILIIITITLIVLSCIV